MKGKNQKVKRKAVTKLRGALIMLLVAVFSISGIICVNAATIKDDGKYSLVLQCGGWSEEGTIDGETSKIVKFDVADGEDSVSIAELTKGIVPFDGEHEFSHWSTDFSGTSKADDKIPISNFTRSGNVYLNDGTELEFNNGFCLYGVFSEKPLKGTGTYYLNLDAFGGTIEDKSVYQITSKSDEFKTVDLTKYEPERKGCTFKGWDLNGKFVNKITAADFADRDSVTVTATYVSNIFYDDEMSVTLNANGGTIEGEESVKRNYLGGGNSGTSMSLLPYVPVRNGYIFNGWNAKKDGSGKNYKYLYWREWDKENWDNDRESEFERDDLITEDGGYERYLNLTLYATWTKDASTPDDTVKVIESNDGIKGSIEFADGIDSTYKLIINNVNVNKDLADKNVKFIADIKVLKDNEIVQISGTKMKIRIALPEELKGYNTYSVVYILNDEIKETIPATLQDGYIVFETTHLSEYGIIATNTNSTPGNLEDNSNKNADKKTKAENEKSTSNATDTKSTSPKTGSEGMLILLLAILLISGGTVTELLILSGKKREKNRK